ncbi:MAG: DUF2059 domain-containing protein [Bacteroidetes bacterium]|nr:DUF2059 domain-containing protein [Bacteroidota bacterium]
MLRTAIVATLFLSSFTVSAQDSTKIRHIRQLMELTGMARLGNQMMTNIISSYKQNYPAATTEFWDAFMKEADMSQLFEKIIPVYEQNFSDDDIKELIVFYQSPVGRKMIDKMPVIMQQSMQIGSDWGKQLSEKVIEKLKQKGYIKQS